MKSFAVLITNTKNFQKGSRSETGFDVRELAYVWQLQRTSQVKLIFCSPRGGECQMDPQSLKDSERDSIVRDFLKDSEAMQMVKNTKRVSDLTAEQAHCAILIGGHGCLFDFADCRDISMLLQRVWFKNRGIIAAIAQGTIGLVNLKCSEEEEGSQDPFIRNKQITCSSDEEERRFKEELPYMVEDKLESMGAKVETAGPNQVNVVITEDRLITAQNTQSSERFVQVIKDLMDRYK